MFSADGFIPRRICGLWPTWLVWEHVVGNALVWLAYLTLPLVIWRLGQRRPELRPFRRAVLAFAGFVLLCGLGHILEMVAFFRPLYRIEGHILVATGLVSWWTVWELTYAWPALMAMRNPAALEREIEERVREIAQAHRELVENERNYRSLTEAIPQLIWTTRPDGYTDYLSRQWLDYTGATESEHLGDGWVNALHPDDRERVQACWVAAYQDGESYDIEYRLRGSLASYRWFQTRGQAIRDSEGRVTRWLGTCTDINDRVESEWALRVAHEKLEERVRERTYELEAEVAERLRAEDELRRAKEEAEAGTLAKGSFLANMSHEIRTPMNGVMGMTDLLLDTRLDDEQRSYLATIHSSGEALLTIINDILDFSKIEAGKMRLDATPFDLKGLLEEVTRLLSPTARQKKIGLSCNVAPGVPSRVVGDPVRIRQVITNLAANAVKFTDAGEVRIMASVVSESPTEATVRITVNDTGIGISQDHRATIFESFNQVEGDPSRKLGGTGLGLTICRSLVELMGGRLGLESVMGRGSAFWFELSFGKAATVAPAWAEPIRPPSNEPLSISLRVLIAEDHKINRKVAVGMLERLGCRADTAADGVDALAALERGTYDLVLMDLQMPHLDGIAATIEIRRREQATGRHIPVIALTANAMAGDRERCMAAGMDGYLSKPIRPQELLDELLRLARAKGDLAAKPPDDDVFDANLLDDCGGDPALIRTIIDAFLATTPVILNDIKDAVASGDARGLDRATHRLIGSCRTLDAAPMLKTCEALINAARHVDLDAARTLVAILRGQWDVVRGRLIAHGS